MDNASYQMDNASNYSELDQYYMMGLSIMWFSYTILLPIICVPGILVTMMSVTVFICCMRLKSLRDSFSLLTLLLAVSLVDMGLLCGSLILFPGCAPCWVSYPEQCDYCSVVLQYMMPVLSSFQFMSVWLCVAITCDRYIAICYPFYHHIKCRGSRPALTVIVGIVFCALVFRAPLWVEFDGPDTTELRNNDDYKLYYKLYASLTVLFILPWTIMLYTNSAVWLAIRRSAKMRDTLMNITVNKRIFREKLSSVGTTSKTSVMTNDGDCLHLSATRKCTTMVGRFGMLAMPTLTKAQLKNYIPYLAIFLVLAVALSFVVFYSPSFLIQSFDAFNVQLREPTLIVVKDIITYSCNVLVCLNSATNFIFYYAFGSWFRKVFNTLVVQCSPSSLGRMQQNGGPVISNGNDDDDDCETPMAIRNDMSMVHNPNDKSTAQSAYRSNNNLAMRKSSSLTHLAGKPLESHHRRWNPYLSIGIADIRTGTALDYCHSAENSNKGTTINTNLNGLVSPKPPSKRLIRYDNNNESAKLELQSMLPQHNDGTRSALDMCTSEL